ncbi:hypothetical protein [Saccharopolyspora tripterygii]
MVELGVSSLAVVEGIDRREEPIGFVCCRHDFQQIGLDLAGRPAISASRIGSPSKFTPTAMQICADLAIGFGIGHHRVWAAADHVHHLRYGRRSAASVEGRGRALVVRS